MIELNELSELRQIFIFIRNINSRLIKYQFNIECRRNSAYKLQHCFLTLEYFESREKNSRINFSIAINRLGERSGDRNLWDTHAS